MKPHKLTFQEAWETMTVFYVDEDLENEIDQQVESLIKIAKKYDFHEKSVIEPLSLATLLTEQENALEFILHEIELSEEKFLRIISLLRRIGRIPDPFDVEWSINRIKRNLSQDQDFAVLIARLLIDGKRDPVLQKFIPRYYLETLNFREIFTNSIAARQVRYKRALIGTYSGRKGYKIEERIQEYLKTIHTKYGIGFEKGRSRFIDTNIDFAIPSLNDPWVIIMSSFQETTSSGQSTKARDMLSAFEQIRRSNNRHGEDRAFVNFVDGGGWLARKRDLQRLVENCHYFVNINNLNLLESIVLQHMPRKYFSR